jgi:hypothetical protein
VAVLDTAVTYRVRAGAAFVPFPEAWSNLGLALLERTAAGRANGDPGHAGDAARARAALTEAWRLRPDPALRRRMAELERLEPGDLR